MAISVQTCRPSGLVRLVTGSPSAVRQELTWAQPARCPTRRLRRGGRAGADHQVTPPLAATPRRGGGTWNLCEAGAVAPGLRGQHLLPGGPGRPVARGRRNVTYHAAVGAGRRPGSGRSAGSSRTACPTSGKKSSNFAVAAQRDLSRTSLAPYAARAIVQRLARAIRAERWSSTRTAGCACRRRAGRPDAPAPTAHRPARLRERGGASSLSMTVAGEAWCCCRSPSQQHPGLPRRRAWRP
ncbi:hypothetical protein HBB16_10500 [Pseudonocardia sp. MCCB 268]|nr:hypothetical protein [Pseudonocardia cytotoxica]